MKKLVILLVLLLVACGTQVAKPQAREPIVPVSEPEAQPIMQSEPVKEVAPVSEPVNQTVVQTSAPIKNESGNLIVQNESIKLAPHKTGPLGDLSDFSQIAKDTLNLVKENKAADAKKRISDLETEWDDRENHLKPMSPRDWSTVDSAIDAALREMRSHNPDASRIESSLVSLITVLDSLS